ncbi:MAG: RluA family pseudouridine synthase [Candidatus Methylacidiphilales bacterium]|nr:RluA family pseudouridine synthase [Candidatus Methylacidiphilales bacterium]
MSNAEDAPALTWMRGPAPPVDQCRILAECEDFAVIEKPPQVLVHPTKPTGEPTLLSWLQEKRPGHFWSLVQRLDRETSGLLLAAKSTETSSALGKILMARELYKEYLVLVHGCVFWEHATFEGPIGRIGISENNPIWLKRGILPETEGGQASLTLVECLATVKEGTCIIPGVKPGYSLLRAMPETGRPHQIRVHLANAGYPLVGDKIYGPDPLLYLEHIDHGWTPRMDSFLPLRRHALHAHRLRFAWKGEPWYPTSPLAEDMAQFALQQGLSLAGIRAPAAAE